MREKIETNISRFLISVDSDSEIFIDTINLGILRRGEFKTYEVFAGEHYIEAKSLDGSGRYKALHSVQLGYQDIIEIKLLPSDLSIGLPGQFTDPRDNRKYKTVQINGKIWLAENLKFKIHRSWCYADNQNNLSKYGLLYNFDFAKEACPQGWHLPTKEEWNELVLIYNPDTIISDLVPNGKSNFNLVFGGRVFCRMSNNGIIESMEINQNGKFWLDENTVQDGTRDVVTCADFSQTKFTFARTIARQHNNSYCGAISIRCVKDY